MSDRPAKAPLNGVGVIVTRPSLGAAALVSRVRRLGGIALRLPGSSLQATAFDPSRGHAAPAQAWIFSSPAAVHFALKGLTAETIGAAPVFAIGNGTRQALARHGIAATAAALRSDSEGLLALAGLAEVAGWRIVLVGAPGGREVIGPVLVARGALVESLHVYVRRPPRLTRRHFDAVERVSGPIVTLLSSGEGLDHLVAQLPPPLLHRLQRQALVVSSDRLAALAARAGFERVHRALSASPAALVDGAIDALALQPR